MRVRHLLALALLPLLGACLEPVDPTAVPVAEVVVSFGTGGRQDTIGVRGTTRANAAAVSREGVDLGRTGFTYESSDTTVATVSDLGIVRGVRPGRVTITARLDGGRQGDGVVVVLPSAVAYTIPVGGAPRALAFSPDYTRLYVLAGADSLVVVDALGYFRFRALSIPAGSFAVAATGDAIYVSHPDRDSVSVVSPANNEVVARIFVGGRPTALAANATRAFAIASADSRVVALADGRAVESVPLQGELHDLALARDGRRLYVTASTGGSWRVDVLRPATLETVASIPLPAAATAITTDVSGERVWVLLAGESRVIGFAEQADGSYRATGSVPVGAGARGISAQLAGVPYVVASGEPLTILDGGGMRPSEQAPGIGTGPVAVRPDGLFAFIGDLATNSIRVLGL